VKKLIAAALILWPALAFAQPKLGSNCTKGTSIITGSTNTAGKVMMGPNNTTGQCTLVFSTASERACVAVEQESGDFSSLAGGATPTTTTMVIGSLSGWNEGDLISYICQTF
jgi:hypothetical protein